MTIVKAGGRLRSLNFHKFEKFQFQKKKFFFKLNSLKLHYTVSLLLGASLWKYFSLLLDYFLRKHFHDMSQDPERVVFMPRSAAVSWASAWTVS